MVCEDMDGEGVASGACAVEEAGEEDVEDGSEP